MKKLSSIKNASNKKKQFTISALIIAKNEEKMIANCIKALLWCNEIIVVDDGSIDKTREIAENLGAKVITFKHSSFSRLREEALKRATSDWVIYIDADERVTPILSKEIKVMIETSHASVFRIRRKNVYFGKNFKWGGWQDDWVERVFEKGSLLGWSGEVHESPNYAGDVIDLKTSLIHFTHRDTVSGLLKTAAWTPIEAQALYKSNIAPVGIWTIFRKGFMEFLRRAIFKRGYKDGVEGVIEAIIQGINRALVYIQVWELQQKPSIQERYQQKEEKIMSDWKAEK
jgi:glycosyltransferase involved in cell wall biosynthesis